MRIVFMPMDAFGHVNSCLGLARQLMNYGHECIFLVPTNWTKTVDGNGFQILNIKVSDVDPLQGFDDFLKDKNDIYDMEPLEKFKLLNVSTHDLFMGYLMKADDQYAALLEKVKPDLIIFDFWVTVPAIVKHGAPYVLLWSISPTLPYWKVNAPSYSSGFGIDDDPEKIKQFRDALNECMKDSRSKFDEYYRSKDIDPSTLNYLDFTCLGESPFLNIYSYPEYLDYSEYGPVPDKWFRVEHMVRIKDESVPLGIDESFFGTNDKTILLTLGTIGSSNHQIINRIINILSKSKHRYIVSMGANHSKIKLPSNMTGGRYLNQIAIIPRVDLVIHHGGNNSLLETLYFAKPFIILPLFGDQHDNGRRVVDKNIGKCFHPKHVTETELLEAIDDTLNDDQLIERINCLSKNIRETKSHDQLNEKLIQIVQQHKGQL